MAEAKATLNTYRQSPRKVRVVADLVRGKSVEDALTILEFVPKRAGLPLRKLIASAYANAGKASNLVVKSITVDGGQVLKRRMPRARGSAYPIKKRTSHVNVVLAEKK
jgi:large subunit ribosomal protein L22